MQYDFDCIIDRTQIDSVKWTAYPKDVLPLWVADSDFQSPEPVVAAVKKIVDTKVFGYPNSHSGVLERAAVSWCRRKYNFTFSESEIHYCPSMSFGLAIAIRAFTQPGGKVLMQTPIYPPFTELTKANGRVCSMNPLKFVNGRYGVDFLASRR